MSGDRKQQQKKKMSIFLDRGPGDLLWRRCANAFSDYYTTSVQRSQSQRRRYPLLNSALHLICLCWLWADSWYLLTGRKMNTIWNAQRKNTASWKLRPKFISDLNQQNCLKNKLNPNNKARLIKATMSNGFTKKNKHFHYTFFYLEKCWEFIFIVCLKKMV